MAFGGVMVDQRNVTDRFPGPSLVTGLIANALGWDHAEGTRLNDLQFRLRLAARLDRAGSLLTDYHTVRLHSDDRGWTTRGTPEGRKGGAQGEFTHIRFRHYWADAVVLVAVGLDPETEDPDPEMIAAALKEPARPLFIGRKTCLPAGLIFLGVREARSPLAALTEQPLDQRGNADEKDSVLARWPADEPDGPKSSDLRGLFDQRDWVNQIHTGERWVREGMIQVPPSERPGTEIGP